MSLAALRRFSLKETTIKRKVSGAELLLPEYSVQEYETVLRSGHNLIDYKDDYLHYYYPEEELMLKFNGKKVIINGNKLAGSDPLTETITDIMLRIREENISKQLLPRPSRTIREFADHGTTLESTMSLRGLYNLQQALRNWEDYPADTEAYSYNEAVLARYGIFKNVDKKPELSFNELLRLAGIHPYPTIILDSYLYLKRHLRGWNDSEHEFVGSNNRSSSSDELTASFSSGQLDRYFRRLTGRDSPSSRQSSGSYSPVSPYEDRRMSASLPS